MRFGWSYRTGPISASCSFMCVLRFCVLFGTSADDARSEWYGVVVSIFSLAFRGRAAWEPHSPGIYIHMYMCMCTYTSTCICIHIQISIHIYIYMYVYAYVHMRLGWSFRTGPISESCSGERLLIGTACVAAVFCLPRRASADDARTEWCRDCTALCCIVGCRAPRDETEHYLVCSVLSRIVCDTVGVREGEPLRVNPNIAVTLGLHPFNRM